MKRVMQFRYYGVDNDANYPNYSGVNYLVKNKNVLREKKKMTKVEGPLEKPIQKLEMEEDKK